MEVFNAVIGRLQDFKSSCDAKVGNTEFSSWTPTKVNLNLPAQPVYNKLAQIFIGATDQNAKFDCGLALRPEFEGQINGGIFADFRVAQSGGECGVGWDRSLVLHIPMGCSRVLYILM